jgi:hypothetical protein
MTAEEIAEFDQWLRWYELWSELSDAEVAEAERWLRLAQLPDEGLEEDG